MKNFLVRLSVATPIVGGVLVILLLVAGSPSHSTPPKPSILSVQSGTNSASPFLNAVGTSLNSADPPPTLNWPLMIIVVVGFTLLGVQTWANYSRQWYDPTLALKYLDLFFEDGAVKRRQAACQHYLKNNEWNTDIEETLDLLDDLGFYVQTIHVSREVLYQHLYWWIRGYVVLADSYISLKQAGDSKSGEPADPTRWDHCRFLLHEVSQVERKRLKKSRAADQRVDWDAAQKARFLREEAGLTGDGHE